MKNLNNIISIEAYIDKRVRKQINDICEKLIKRGYEETPDNPFRFGVNCIEQLKSYTKKDWEDIYKETLSFEKLRNIQISVENIYNDLKKVMEDYDKTKNS